MTESSDRERCPFCGERRPLAAHFPCNEQPDRDPDPLGGVTADPEAARHTERVTLRVPASLLESADGLVEAGAYGNRSEAIRAAAFAAFVAPAGPNQTPTVPDGGSELEAELEAALEGSDCHSEFTAYCQRAAADGGTPILESVRHFHAESDISRIAEIGTTIERTLWNEGARATLEQHGHVDERNAEILRSIVKQNTAIADSIVRARTEGDVMEGSR